MARKQGPCLKGRKFQDELLHKKHWGFLRQKAQANFRGEGWELTIEEFFELWTDDLWAQRGRKIDNYCMVRIDPEKSWSKENCAIILRYQQLVRNRNPRKNPDLRFPEL